MIKYAQAYAAMGWRVFPLGEKGKKPIIQEWQNKATTDPDTIAGWWTKWPKANIGVALGKETGMFALDVDVKDNESGSKSLNALEQEIGPLPETLEARTGTGGRHLFSTSILQRTMSETGSLSVRGSIFEGKADTWLSRRRSTQTPTRPYSWPYDMENPVEEAPTAFLEVIAPLPAELQQEMPQTPIVRPPYRPEATPVIERASLYLRECDAAVQGSGGHDALLWAARAMVIGFELSDSDALALLWSEFNPRCSPMWDRSKPSDAKDFERKVAEARRTPGQKPQGWLLDDCGLRSNDEALESLGGQWQTNLLAEFDAKHEPVAAATIQTSVSAPVAETVVKKAPKFVPFPMEVLPANAAEYGQRAAEAHGVDLSFVGLPMLIVTSAAMGNAFRLKLKERFVVPPTLWGGLVGASGTNKSGPLRDITEPLRGTPTLEDLGEDDAMLNPQGRLIVQDITTESVVYRLSINPRGQLCFRGELARWIKSFDAYKNKSSGDEQAWLEFWDAHEYQLDRKTNAEEVFIPAAAASVLGGIQPKVLVECFDPGKFASGLVPRLLIAHPPDRGLSGWTDVEIDPKQQSSWHDMIMWLRTRPFASLDTNTAQYLPHIWTLSPTAKARHTAFYAEVRAMTEGKDELFRTFASKSRVIAARLALCIHGLYLANVEGIPDIYAEAVVSQKSMEAGITLARWFLNEQLRVYGLANAAYNKLEVDAFIAKIKVELGGSCTARRLQRTNSKKYLRAQDAKIALNELVAAGLGTWDAKINVFTLK